MIEIGQRLGDDDPLDVSSDALEQVETKRISGINPERLACVEGAIHLRGFDLFVSPGKETLRDSMGPTFFGHRQQPLGAGVPKPPRLQLARPHRPPRARHHQLPLPPARIERHI